MVRFWDDSCTKIGNSGTCESFDRDGAVWRGRGLTEGKKDFVVNLKETPWPFFLPGIMLYLSKRKVESHMKKLTSFFLALALSLSLLTTAFAASLPEDDKEPEPTPTPVVTLQPLDPDGPGISPMDDLPNPGTKPID